MQAPQELHAKEKTRAPEGQGECGTQDSEYTTAHAHGPSPD